MSAQPRILVVDDDTANVRSVAETLNGSGYTIDTASDGVEALEKVRTAPPDLILLDVLLPGMNGLEVCRIVKSMFSNTFVPIILVAVQGDVDSNHSGLKLSADDYLAKPYNPLELKARLSSMLRIKALQDKLMAKRRELEVLSVTDELTGLLNHRAMQVRLSDEFLRAQRNNRPLSVLMIDLDHFKTVNDTHGYLFGDYVLTELGQLLRDTVRGSDVVARYAGEEFLAILPETHFNDSVTVADRIWRRVESNTFIQGKVEHNCAISIGVSFVPNKHVVSVDDLIGFAEQSVSLAKREGGNRICSQQHLSYMYKPARASSF